MRKSVPIKLFLVDDSTFARVVLAKHLNRIKDFEVIGQARDGEEAVELIPQLKPDVVIMDVVMPRMNGLEALTELMRVYPVPVIMLSSLTKEGADETIQALTLGAIDFHAKPSTKANIAQVVGEMEPKIRQAAAVEQSLLKNPQNLSQDFDVPQVKLPQRLERPEMVVVIGSSTGGPKALSALIPLLPRDLNAAYLVVQHMPAGFTKPLAERLDQLAAVRVKEAEHADALLAGQVLIAPGGYHLELQNQHRVTLNTREKICGVRPAVNATMFSAADHYQRAVLGVVLTGMGKDGRDGALAIRKAGGAVIAEDKSTCVVWGMPRSVVEADGADFVVPLPAIPDQIITTVTQHIGNA
mgnify:CR=1 FL=1